MSHSKQYHCFVRCFIPPTNFIRSYLVSSSRQPTTSTNRLTNQSSTVASHMKTCEFQVKSHKLRTAHFLQDLQFRWRKIKMKMSWLLLYDVGCLRKFMKILGISSPKYQPPKIKQKKRKKRFPNYQHAKKKRWKHLIRLLFRPAIIMESYGIPTCWFTCFQFCWLKVSRATARRIAAFLSNMIRWKVGS